MPAKVSRTLKVLLEIRDDARRFRESVDDRFESLEERFAHSQSAITAELTANRLALQEIAQIIRGWRDRFDTRLEDHEHRLQALEQRTG